MMYCLILIHGAWDDADNVVAYGPFLSEEAAEAFESKNREGLSKSYSYTTYEIVEFNDPK